MIENGVVHDQDTKGNEEMVNVQRLNEIVQLEDLLIEVDEEKVVTAEEQENAIDQIGESAKEIDQSMQAEVSSQLSDVH